MLVKILNKEYDELNEDGYYLYSLKNNNYMDKYISYSRSLIIPYNYFHLGNVKSNIISKDVIINKLRNDLTDYNNDGNVVLERDRRPNSIPLIGEYKDNELKDIITGKTINSELPGLAYDHVIRIPLKIVKEVLNSLNIEDIKNYSNTILKIEQESIAKEKSI